MKHEPQSIRRFAPLCATGAETDSEITLRLAESRALRAINDQFTGRGSYMSENKIENKRAVKKVCPCCEKHTVRDEKHKKALLNRLKRIEGQVRGIRAMVEDDRYCVDILTQVSAIQAALNGFNKELLARHIKTCVSEDIREGNEEAVDELCGLLKKLMK